MTPEQRKGLKAAALNLMAARAGPLPAFKAAQEKYYEHAPAFAILSLIAQVEALTVPADYFAPLVLNPTCACAKCNPNAAGRMMILCATCGNKRCPHATDHRLACTDSNEPGQVGSSYGPTIPAIPGTKEGA